MLQLSIVGGAKTVFLMHFLDCVYYVHCTFLYWPVDLKMHEFIGLWLCAPFGSFPCHNNHSLEHIPPCQSCDFTQNMMFCTAIVHCTEVQLEQRKVGSYSWLLDVLRVAVPGV